LVVAGISGPATFAASKMVREITTELPYSTDPQGHGPVLWAAISADVFSDSKREGDSRQVGKPQFVVNPTTWRKCRLELEGNFVRFGEAVSRQVRRGSTSPKPWRETFRESLFACVHRRTAKGDYEIWNLVWGAQNNHRRCKAEVRAAAVLRGTPGEMLDERAPVYLRRSI